MIPKLSARSFLFEYLLVRKKQNFYSWCRVGRPRWTRPRLSVSRRPSVAGNLGSTIDHRPSTIDHRERRATASSPRHSRNSALPAWLCCRQRFTLHASRGVRVFMMHPSENSWAVTEVNGGPGGTSAREAGPPGPSHLTRSLPHTQKIRFPYHLRRLVLYTWSGWEYVVAGVVGPLEDDRSSAG